MIDPFPDKSGDTVHLGFPVIHRDETKMDEMVFASTADEAETTGHSLRFDPDDVEFDLETDGSALLDRFSDRWQVVDDLSMATVLEVRTEFALVRETAVMSVAETSDTSTYPEGDAKSILDDSVPLADRYSHVPASPEEVEFKFAERGVDPVSCDECGAVGHVRCMSCTGAGEVRCSRCSGSGTIGCPNCGGSGVVSDGEGGTTSCRKCKKSGTARCPDCGSSGIVSCLECVGQGRLECRVCAGDGARMTIDHGEIRTTVSRLNAVFSELVPSRVLRDCSDRTLIGQSTVEIGHPVAGKEVPHIEASTFSLVPVVSVTYEYGGDEYTLHNVAGDLTSGDSGYPKSQSRRLVPYLFVLLLVASAITTYVLFL